MHTDWSLVFLILVPCALLLFVALVAVATVLISSRHSFDVWRRLKSTMAVLVWIVPAAAIVFLIGVKSQQRFVAVVPQSTNPAVQSKEFIDGQRQITTQLATAETSHKAQAATASSAEESSSANSVASARLKVRQVSSDDPKWTAGSYFVGGREVVVLSSQRFATLAEAEENVTAMALQQIREHWSGEALLDFSGQQLRLPQSLRSEDVRGVVVDLVDRFAVKDLVGEVMDWDFKNGTTGKMYRAHLRLDFTPQLHDALQERGRALIVEGRVLHFGGLLGLVTLMLATAAGYFKLDDATAGAYRRRLKLAAVALIAAGGLATARVLGS